MILHEIWNQKNPQSLKLIPNPGGARTMKETGLLFCYQSVISLCIL